jgi:uncharacterized protein
LGWVRGLVYLARRYGRELGGEPTAVICGSCALLILAHHHASTSSFFQLFGSRFAGHPAAGTLPYFWWFASSLVLFLAVPLALSLSTRGSFTRCYGLGLGDLKAGLLISALFLVIMLPTVLVASRHPAFAGHYPLAGRAAYTLDLGEGKAVVSGWLFLFYEVGYFLYFIGWEFLFRGWMLNGLLPRFGRAGAVLVQTAPFAVMHLGKPELEAFGSIAAGLALGVLALRTRSFWYGAFLHGAIAVWMDLLASWAYVFPSNAPP